ncbi:glutamine ABC transporter substrate-binding protein [Aquisalimonas sp. 2447]|uniref:glutamine ABC transporter substrate-binding protein n=1 Tax=Aquisalimonas sp. 2447 TaxID=2740807 RepID=UPI001432677C|nr:glutamine ABC transporter substrate-binding protein [Aquisalimonas sp. 2447]QIT54550.1 glutamine ABC transporter substrate-binding protein [Aquisalimonas sp. 2447]
MRRLLLSLCTGFALFAFAASSHADRLTIAIPSGFVPFMFEEDGEWTGFEIELLEAIAEENDWEYEYDTMNFSGIISALQTGRVDGAIAAITITSDREETMDFSHAYYDSGLMLMVRADNDDVQGIDDLDGKTLAVTTGTTSDDYAEENLPDTEITRFPRAEQAYLEVRSGRVDAALHDTPNVLYYIDTAGDGDVKAVGENLEAQSYAMAFPRNSELRNDFNISLLGMMEDGRYAELYERWFGEAPSPR